MVTRCSNPATCFRRLAGLVTAASLAVCVALALPAAQQVPPNLTKEDLAKDNKLFITLARKALKWDEPTAPSKIVGALHYVGTAGLASYLFATKEGHILFNTGILNPVP
jgi:metallo-beta-lactamase class B